jgi:hypothetical protein
VRAALLVLVSGCNAVVGIPEGYRLKDGGADAFVAIPDGPIAATADARPRPDSVPGQPDAFVADAVPGQPDAFVADAVPGQPDARPIPDAKPVQPDAAPPPFTVTSLWVNGIQDYHNVAQGEYLDGEIYGTNFAGITSVKFGNIPVTISSNTGTKIVFSGPKLSSSKPGDSLPLTLDGAAMPFAVSVTYMTVSTSFAGPYFGTPEYPRIDLDGVLGLWQLAGTTGDIKLLAGTFTGAITHDIRGGVRLYGSGIGATFISGQQLIFDDGGSATAHTIENAGVCATLAPNPVNVQVTFNDLNFKNCSTAISLSGLGKVLRWSGSIDGSVTASDDAIIVTNSAAAYMGPSEIKNAYGGVRVADSTVWLSGFNIHDNTHAAVTMTGASGLQIGGSTIANNGPGLEISGAPTYVQLWQVGFSANTWSNTSYDLVDGRSAQSAAIDATQNYFHGMMLTGSVTGPANNPPYYQISTAGNKVSF